MSIDGTAGGKLINYWNNSNVTITARGTDNYFVEKFVVTGTRDGKSISKYELDADYTANAEKTTIFREPDFIISRSLLSMRLAMSRVRQQLHL